MSSIVRYGLAFLALCGMAAFLFLAKRQEKKNGLRWTMYPGFCVPPSVQYTAEQFGSAERKQAYRELLGMLIWAVVFPALALYVAGENTALELKLLQIALKLLPPILLVFQEAELMSGFRALHTGKGIKAFCTIAWIKWILVGLWLLGFFASLVVKGFEI